MNPWPFVIAAYGVTLLAAGALTLASWLAMRRAEQPPVASNAER